MALLDDIYTMAAVFAGPESEGEQAALRAMCQAASDGLTARLRPGVSAETCGESFVCAAAWIALGSYSAAAGADGIGSFTAGDVTVSSSGKNAAAEALRLQAELTMAPYLQDTVQFAGVRG